MNRWPQIQPNQVADVIVDVFTPALDRLAAERDAAIARAERAEALLPPSSVVIDRETLQLLAEVADECYDEYDDVERQIAARLACCSALRALGEHACFACTPDPSEANDAALDG